MYVIRVLSVIIFLLCLAIPVRCEELITGRVVSVDRDKGEVILDISPDNHDNSGESPEGGKRQVRIVVEWNYPLGRA